MPTLVCFGDSNTADSYDANGTPRLTPRIADSLNGWKVINAGISGETTRDALARIKKDVADYYPSLVTVLFGSNDSARNRDVSLEEYEKNLRLIVEQLSPEKTILISPPPVVEAAQINNRDNATLAKYAQIVQKVARETGSHFIDLFTEMKDLPDYSELLVEDGLHISEQGYVFLSHIITAKIKSIQEVN
ncbi:GDSL-type esterase/lipase family protein [Paenactinomyces guangxiensis]|uniref:Esterase n=1 Tax=Paenactinomyces guangxiensis TaxID=1490290 RepID=A0A7W2A8T9_9BACL|nr:GDSL-type esterase/lipase family protein [Paenactinomyces guangxiensis]MBA4494208.1 esterase [Paenactinomyces guangxiensis]MBH8590704.1 esterase [Paenactinomyces guangxiensis]